ncbi:unnamed protein product [Cladocopium goreaui]|uniref:Dihydrofolate synthetase n=2 Tax=Cladocopium goreaui TaxID=2562237 RepID=A0A9P1GSM4_9DINO|nr:unnamed protein product [Cladocopium goreaui]
MGRFSAGRWCSLLAFQLAACIFHASLRFALYPVTRPHRALAARGASRRQLEAEDFRELLERPEGAQDLQDILKEMLADEDQLKESNETFQAITAAQRGREAADPLAKFLSDPQQVWSWMQSSDKTQQLSDMMNRSPLFEKLRNFGASVLERRQVAQLPPGALVEITALKEASHLNSLVGEVVEPTPEETQEFADRKIVHLEDGQGRVAVHPRNLVFPRHKPGDAVILDAEFEPGTEHEGLENRAAVVSMLTQEEKELGFDEKSGRLVVDVLSLLPGGPVLQRILMWPEHLQRRPFQVGDSVELRDLRADAKLNGAAGVVQGPGTETWKYLVTLDDGRRLEIRWKNLLLTNAMPTTPFD